MFFRIHTDGTREPLDLQGFYAGPVRGACWIIGGGPSLSALPTADIAATPVPRFGINLAGHALLRPTFWTSYDPTHRFHRSTYLDASILKFLPAGRAMDLVPETTFKVCDCPATLFFERDKHRGYRDFLSRESSPRSCASTGSIATSSPLAVTDWQDSLIQSIDIAYRLGFRTLYLAGCDMAIHPSAEQLSLARSAGVEHHPREPLRDFFARCRQAGLSQDDFEQLDSGPQYHFDERKPLAAAIQTDFHYFRVAQYLRLSRRAMSLAGLDLISVTPDSRLNDCFEYRLCESVVTSLLAAYGDPRTETTRGRYTAAGPRPPANLAPMKDFPPHNWKRDRAVEDKPVSAGKTASRKASPRCDRSCNSPAESALHSSARQRLRDCLDDLPEIPVHLDERG